MRMLRGNNKCTARIAGKLLYEGTLVTWSNPENSDTVARFQLQSALASSAGGHTGCKYFAFQLQNVRGNRTAIIL